MDLIPEFLTGDIIAFNIWPQRMKQKPYVITITRNMKFYEFQCKKLLSEFDLKPYLGKFENELLQYKVNIAKDNVYSTRDVPIYFGKFIYTNLELKRVYVLVHCCCDVLVVLERLCDASGFVFTAMYEQVESYKLIQAEMQYHASVKISFYSGEVIITDFQTTLERNEVDDHQSKNRLLLKNQRADFRRMLSRLRTTQAELHTHKTTMQKDFEYLRNTKSFGASYTRSLNLEGKRKLTRCGDVWIRTTPTNWVVIGIPLISNCLCSDDIIVQNIRPVLGTIDTTLPGISYAYKIFQLSRNSETSRNSLRSNRVLETDQLEDIFNGANDQKQHILPDSLYALLIKVKLCQLTMLRLCSIVLLFDVINKKSIKPLNNRVVEQQIFLKTLDIADILNQHNALNVFQNLPRHQEILAIIFTAQKLNLNVHYNSMKDVISFRDFLVTRCELVKCSLTDENKSMMPQTFFYNQNAQSSWFGVLVFETPNENEKLCKTDDFKILWTFFNANKEKLFLLLNFIFKELLSVECNMSLLECTQFHELQLKDSFAFTICQELQSLNEKCSITIRNAETAYNDLLKLELHTDLMVAVGKLNQ